MRIYNKELCEKIMKSGSEYLNQNINIGEVKHNTDPIATHINSIPIDKLEFEYCETYVNVKLK